MGRLFALTLVLAAVVAGAGAVTAVALLVELAGCYLDWVPLPDRPICGAALWGSEAVPFVVVGVSAMVTGGSVVLLFAGFRSQFGRANKLARELRSLAVAPPDRVRACAARIGLDGFGYVQLDAPVAITIGVRRPVVFISSALVDLLDDPELEAVLLHEQEHQLRRHPAVFGLARLAAGAAFVVPTLRRLASAVVLTSEVEADAAATRAAGVRPLVSALRKLSFESGVVTDAAIGSIRGMLDERIRALSGHPASSQSTRGAIVVSMVGTLVAITPLAAVAVAYLRVHGVV